MDVGATFDILPFLPIRQKKSQYSVGPPLSRLVVGCTCTALYTPGTASCKKQSLITLIRPHLLFAPCVLVTNGVVSGQGGRFAEVGYGEEEIYKHGDTSV